MEPSRPKSANDWKIQRKEFPSMPEDFKPVIIGFLCTW